MKPKNYLLHRNVLFDFREYLAFMRRSKPDMYGDLPEDPLELTNASDPFRLLNSDFDSKVQQLNYFVI